jgi:U3 small nucleolar RNA-associated protein 13
LAIFYSSFALSLYEIPTFDSVFFVQELSTHSKTKYVQPVRVISKCHDAPVHVCSIDPSSTLLASGSADGIVKVWDIQKGYVTHLFKGHGGIVSALAFNFPRETSSARNVDDDRFQLFTASSDTRIRMFDLSATSSRSAGAKAQEILEGHVSVPRGLDVTADGRWLVSGGRDSVVMVWDLTGGQQISKEKGKANLIKPKPSLVKTIPVLERVESVGVITSTEFVAASPGLGPNGGTGRLRFYTGGEKGVIRLWDATTAEVIASYGADPSEKADRPSEEPREIIAVMCVL